MSERTHFQPSLLDRLQDDEPSLQEEAHPWRTVEVEQQKAALARDLEALLNTRCTCQKALDPDLYPLASASLLSFGIMDLSSLSLHSPQDQLKLKKCLLETIARHEPRLSGVRVELQVPAQGTKAVRFRVEGELMVHPDQPAVGFDAFLQLSSNTYQVKG